MKEEISRVLTMMEEGKIDAAKASELIELLKTNAKSNSTNRQEESYQQRSNATSSNYYDKMLKIRITSEENDNVNINLPIKLVKFVLGVGHGIAASIPEASKYVKDIDVDLLLHAIDNELDGQIVDIRSNNSDTVSVYIE